MQVAGSWVQSNLARAVAHDVSVTHFVLASSKRELGDLRYVDRQNRKIIIKKRRVDFMGGKPLFTTPITANAHNLSVCQFLPKAPKNLCILKKKTLLF